MTRKGTKKSTNCEPDGNWLEEKFVVAHQGRQFMQRISTDVFGNVRKVPTTQIKMTTK